MIEKQIMYSFSALSGTVTALKPQPNRNGNCAIQKISKGSEDPLEFIY